MKSLVQYLINESVNENDSVNKAIKAREPFILEGDFVDCKNAIKKGAKNNNYIVQFVYTDIMEKDDFAPIEIGGKKCMPDWAANAMDNGNCILIFVFDVDKNYNDVMNAMMPIFIDNKLFGEKFTNVIPAILTTKNLKLPGALNDKLTHIKL